MRAKEFITEDLKQSDEFRPEHDAVLPRSINFPEMSGKYYDMYRMGMNIAGQGNSSNMEAKTGVVASNLMFTAYTDEELEMVEKMAKEMGQSVNHLVKQKSKEPNDTYTHSPVAKRPPLPRRK